MYISYYIRPFVSSINESYDVLFHDHRSLYLVRHAIHGGSKNKNNKYVDCDPDDHQYSSVINSTECGDTTVFNYFNH
jgi:hypothetical protein